ncbi:MAG TPA: alpha/beta fold hydrolase [Polyangiaceae bacterium]|nr:alpha/beta fold hydrolase [Polyangiaceae bacterium]
MTGAITREGDVPVVLHRRGPNSGKGSVLLLHGASATSETFHLPNGGLVDYLQRREWDVWTLDWRGSAHVVAKVLEDPPRPDHEGEYRKFTLDHTAHEDIPWALDLMQKELGKTQHIAAVAHCFGSGALSIALAAKQAEAVNNVVLSTLGLFYEAPWDGWIKAEDFILERVLANDPECRVIDPRHYDKWPADMKTAYEVFPSRWMPPGDSEADRILQRLTFMFGQPYPPEVLVPGIHGPKLKELFGAMHLGLYLHAGQMVRRGYAAQFDAMDTIDPPRALESRRRQRAASREPREHKRVPGHYLLPEAFSTKRVTLITGTENRLWHRDGIDRMYEWLLAEAPPQGWGRRPRKHVLPGFAHQDLLWGKESQKVYELIEQALAS